MTRWEKKNYRREAGCVLGRENQRTIKRQGKSVFVESRSPTRSFSLLITLKMPGHKNMSVMNPLQRRTARKPPEHGWSSSIRLTLELIISILCTSHHRTVREHCEPHKRMVRCKGLRQRWAKERPVTYWEPRLLGALLLGLQGRLTNYHCHTYLFEEDADHFVNTENNVYMFVLTLGVMWTCFC